MDEQQRQAFEHAVDAKKQASKEASTHAEQNPETGIDPESPDASSPRQKNSGKGKKTADKWNQ